MISKFNDYQNANTIISDYASKDEENNKIKPITLKNKINEQIKQEFNKENEIEKEMEEISE